LAGPAARELCIGQTLFVLSSVSCPPAHFLCKPGSVQNAAGMTLTSRPPCKQVRARAFRAPHRVSHGLLLSSASASATSAAWPPSEAGGLDNHAHTNTDTRKRLQVPDISQPQETHTASVYLAKCTVCRTGLNELTGRCNCSGPPSPLVLVDLDSDSEQVSTPAETHTRRQIKGCHRRH
jgi:hypothetical protein